MFQINKNQNMKKTIAILAMGALAYGANAQDNSLEAGKICISGSVGFSTGSSESETTSGGTTVTEKGPTTTTMNLIPSIQYFLSKNLSLGLGIGYGSVKIASEDDIDGTKIETTVTNSVISIAPMATYYKPLGGDKFGITVSAMVPLGFGGVKGETKSGSTTVTTESKLNSFGINIQPGIYYFPTSKVMLTANIGNIFSLNKSTQSADLPGGGTAKDTDTKIEILNLNTAGGVGTGLSFGASFFF
jgi:outer membrane protein